MKRATSQMPDSSQIFHSARFRTATRTPQATTSLKQKQF